MSQIPNIIYSQSNTAFEWDITAIRTYSDNGKDVVAQLDWVLTATRLDSQDQPVTANRSGKVKLNYNPNNFITFNQLSKRKLINWVNVKLGKSYFDQLRSALEDEIATQLLTEQAIPL